MAAGENHFLVSASGSFSEMRSHFSPLAHLMLYGIRSILDSPAELKSFFILSVRLILSS